jgi:phospholipid/cholesterol/gamma-HCH transport system permease protein
MHYPETLKETLTFRFFRALTKESMPALALLGEASMTLIKALLLIARGKIHWKNTIDQMSFLGIDALFITLTLTSVSGMIIALQISYEMVKQGASGYVGALVALAIVRELGPVMASFAVTSMIGSGMSAELATMKVTEQIDAMKVLKVDPMYYLMVPRILAGLTMVPLLVIMGNLLGILGGMVVSNIAAGLNMLNYLDSVWSGLEIKDVWVSVLKGGVFGLLITTLSSTIGYATEGGAKEVGKATTTAVVWSFLAIVLFDYLISLIFFA